MLGRRAGNGPNSAHQQSLSEHDIPRTKFPGSSCDGAKGIRTPGPPGRDPCAPPECRSPPFTGVARGFRASVAPPMSQDSGFKWTGADYSDRDQPYPEQPRTPQPCAFRPSGAAQRVEPTNRGATTACRFPRPAGGRCPERRTRGVANRAFCRSFSDGAAQESNLPTVGLQRPAGFEDSTSLALEGRLRVVSDHLSDHRHECGRGTSGP